MGKAICFALAGALVLAGCGSQRSSLGAGGSASSSSAGGGGSGGGEGTGGGAGGGGGVSCTVASISVDGDGPTNHFNAACMGSWGALHTSHANGYLSYPPTSSNAELVIQGCADGMAPPMDGSLQLTIPETGVGNATMGQASYANGTDTFTTATAVTAMITEITSSTIQGSYTANVSTPSNGARMLSGTFSVCRVADYRPK